VVEVKTVIRVYGKTRLRQPYLVTGLPGAGLVAKLAVDYLVRQMKAEVFARLYSPKFAPGVVLKENGTVDLISADFYAWRNDESRNDLILFTGEMQPLESEGNYQVADTVIRFAKKLGSKRLYALASQITHEFVEKPRVLGAVTDPSLLPELGRYGVPQVGQGFVSGLNGLLFGIARYRGLEAISLFAETPGNLSVDPRASEALLEVLDRMLGIRVDMTEIKNFAEQVNLALQESRKRYEEEIKRYLSEYGERRGLI